MADASEKGHAYFVVRGVIRRLTDWSEPRKPREYDYVVLGSNLRENLTEVRPVTTFDGDSMREVTVWEEVAR